MLKIWLVMFVLLVIKKKQFVFSNLVVLKAQTTFNFQWTVYSTWENLKKFTALKIFVKKKRREKMTM